MQVFDHRRTFKEPQADYRQFDGSNQQHYKRRNKIGLERICLLAVASAASKFCLADGIADGGSLRMIDWWLGQQGG